jgi:hypothetical protein
MISAIVIISSVVLAVAFMLAWLLRPSLREEIERPKHWFQDQVHRYDQRCQDGQAAHDAPRVIPDEDETPSR